MTPLVALVTHILAAVSVALDVAVVVILASIALRGGVGRHAFSFFARHAVPAAFAVALASLAGSLFYSEFAGFPPCTLCWIQRICMYPQVILFALILRRRDARIELAAFALSAIGGLVAAYNQYLQFGGDPLIPCGATPGTAACAQRFFLEFGYMTIPMMSLTAFALIGALLMAERIHRG